MKYNKIILFIASFLIVFGFSGCGDSSSDGDNVQTGTLSLNLTDAPVVDELNVTGVYITVTGVEYHTADGWKTMDEFNTSINPINLLDWQDGESISLGDFQLPAGKYTQIRFMLDAEEETVQPKSNTGCSIEFDGDRNETLYVPSGSQTGYKAIGNYEVPVNGRVSMTADFDVRKSIVESRNGTYYKLKPTIKLVVTDEAGSIKGRVSNLEDNYTYVIYAYEYEDGISTWDDTEANDPDPSDSADIRFPNAVTSSLIKDGGIYTLSFLEAGSYDLIVATYDENGDYNANHIEDNVSVKSGETTTFDLSL